MIKSNNNELSGKVRRNSALRARRRARDKNRAREFRASLLYIGLCLKGSKASFHIRIVRRGPVTDWLHTHILCMPFGRCYSFYSIFAQPLGGATCTVVQHQTFRTPHLYSNSIGQGRSGTRFYLLYALSHRLIL